jgi:MFS family permease
MNSTQRNVLSTTCMAHGLIHVYELCVPALLWLIQREFGADDLQMGTVATLYTFLFGFGALPAGFLVDRLGSKPLLLICLWGGSVSMVGMAVSPSLFWFALAACSMGLALSIYHPAGTALITHSMTASGRVFAYHGMAGNLGVAGASVIAGTLGALLGWRWAIALLATAGLLLGSRVLALSVPAPREIKTRPGRGEWPGFVLLLVATAFMGMVYRGMTTFLPKFFAVNVSDDAGVGTAVGGALTTAALLVGLAGMYTAGRIVDRGAHSSWVFLVGAVFQAPFLILIGYVSGPVFLPLFMGVAFFHFFTQPAGNHLVANLTPPRLRGLGYGIYFFMTFGAGSVGGSIGGWVSTHVGLQYTFPALAILLVPSVLAIILLVVRTRSRGSLDRAGEVPETTL